MRVMKLIPVFLLTLSLTAPANLAAQKRGPDPGRGKAKVEKPQKAHPAAQAKKAEKNKKAKKTEKREKADRAPRGQKKPRHAQPLRQAERPDRLEKPKKERRDVRPLRQAAPDRPGDERPRRAPVFRDQRRARPTPQPDRVARDEKIRFRGMDADGDRRISRSEWRGNDVSFGNQDRNGDGILSGAEVLPGARARAGDLRVRHDRLGRRIALAPAPITTRIDRYYDSSRARDGARTRVPYRAERFGGPADTGLVRIDLGLEPVRFERFDGSESSLFDRLALPLALFVTQALVDDVDTFVTTERFASYDRDYDGYLAPAEWPGGGLGFDRYDADGDGYLVRRELYADADLIVVDRDRLLLFQGLDVDDDGLIAPWEWPGDLDSFWFRDENADGAVSLDEYLGLAADRPVRDLKFDAVDYDRDGEIARVEWVGDPYRFHRLDRNDNGVVGRWEYAFGWLRGA